MTLATPEMPLHFRSADGEFGLSLSAAAIKELLEICGATGNMETGGILIGRYSNDCSIALVDQVTGPPADSKHFFARFLRGVAGLQDLLNCMWAKEERRFYLGEWHYHPLPAPNASADDISQMQQIAFSDRYACPEPILVILSGPPCADWRLSATVYPRHKSIVPMLQLTDLCQDDRTRNPPTLPKNVF